MKYIIVAYDKNRLIGGNNTLLWQGEMADDMKRFRDLTTDNVVIMGRKTFDSIGQTLPNRQNIVISRQSLEIDGVQIADSLESAYQICEPNKDIYIIGGGQIFEQALASTDKILATEIDAEFVGDVYFPKLSHDWIEIGREKHLSDARNKYNYDYVDFAKPQSVL